MSQKAAASVEAWQASGAPDETTRQQEVEQRKRTRRTPWATRGARERRRARGTAAVVEARGPTARGSMSVAKTEPRSNHCRWSRKASEREWMERENGVANAEPRSQEMDWNQGRGVAPGSPGAPATMT